MNNWGHDSSVTAKGRKCDDAFQHTVSGQTKLRSDYDGYNHKSQKQSNLASALDKPVVRVEQEEPVPESSNYQLAGRETKATKQMFLASNCPSTGNTSLKGYD